jgi:hypothetical protein
MTGRSWWRIAIAAVLVTGAACGDPTGPGAVASIHLSSAIDTVLAAGRTAQLSALALNAEGDAVPGVNITWSSVNASVVSVDDDGLATAQAAGSTTVTAHVEGGEVSGSITLHVLDADLDGVAALLGDPYAVTVIAGLMGGHRLVAEDLWDRLAADASSGNLVRLIDGIAELRAQAAEAGGADGVLLAVLILYAEQIEQRLGL